MRAQLVKASVLAFCFGVASAVALAEDCFIDSVVDCCPNSSQYIYWLTNSHPNCPPIVLSSPWLPFTSSISSGYTHRVEATRTCSFQIQAWNEEAQECYVIGTNQNATCIGNRISDLAINCNGGGANP